MGTHVVTVQEAEANLAQLLAKVTNGEEVIIARGDKPVARLVAVEEVRKQRVPGRLKGIIDVGPEFFEPLSDDELGEWG